MKIKIILTSLLALLSASLLQAQTLSPSVTSSQGGQSTAGSVNLSWTLGETITPTLTAGSNELSQGFEQPEVEITIQQPIAQLTYCSGSNISFSFIANGFIDASNVFTAQLSNGSGSFSSPVILGTMNGTAGGTFNVTIPVATANGSGYRVRVVGSAPLYNGKDNGANITINTMPTATISGGGNVCSGSGCLPITITFTGGAPYSVTYLANGGGAVTVNNINTSTYIFTPCPSVTTAYTVSSVNRSSVGCSNTGTGTATITLNAAPVAGVASADAIVCSGGIFHATLVGSTGSSIDWQSNSNPANTAGWASTGVSSASFNSSALITNYYFRAVVNSVGCPSVVSNTVTATMSAQPVITASSVDDNSMVLSWTPNQNTGGSYTVTLSPGGFSFPNAISPLTVNGLSAGTLYSVVVTESNPGNCGTPSGNLDVTTTCPAPGVAAAVAVNSTHEQISWVYANVSDTIIYRNLITLSYQRVAAAASPVTITVTNNSSYEVFIRSVCTTGAVVDGPFSYFNVGGTGCAAAPVISSVTPNCATQLTINWGAVAGAASYKVTVERLTPTYLVGTYSVAGTTYTFNNALSGANYQVVVRAVCTSGALSAASAPVQASTSTLLPPPDNVVVSLPTCHGFTVSWSPVAGASAYMVRRQQIGGPTYTQNVTSGATSCTFYTLGLNTTFNISVRSIQDCQSGATSVGNYGSTVPGATSICRGTGQDESPAAMSDLNIYPNPNSGSFMISYVNGTEQSVSYTVTNVFGQEVYNESNTESEGSVQHSLKLSDNMAEGIYFVTIKSGSEIITKQIMIAK